MQPTFDGMILTRAGGNTTLTGPVRDQAELQGLLQRVSNLGLTLLEAVALDEAGKQLIPPPPVVPGSRV